jgi:hypothetical protein|tara:strand:+ start:482 stop:1009 length:528 start_codon:yes stop_codon:yes gene_type:complete
MMKRFLSTIATAFVLIPAWTQPNVTPVFVECTAGEYPNEITWEIMTCDSMVLLGGGAPYFGAALMPDPDRFIIHMMDSYGDGWNGAYLFVGEGQYGFLSDVDWIDSLGTWPQDQPEQWVTVGCGQPITSIDEIVEDTFSATEYYNLFGQRVQLNRPGYYVATDGTRSKLIYRRED